VLTALRIPIMRLDDPAKVPHRIQQALTLAYASNKPVAVLLTRDLMWEDA
jgi:sulfopyruvate decarboxylase subunit alpha